jgi:hypothetical protein
MIASRRFRPARLAGAGLAALLVLLVPSRAAAWGSLGHRTIAAAYGSSLPPALQPLRVHDAWIVDHVMDPDLRKSSVPGEGYRHYIDIDAYAEYHAGTLPHERAVLEAMYGAAQVEAWGIAPWAIGQVVDSMTAAMVAGDWTKVRYWTADLCHYAGDLHQPLHCTLNYDGQLTGNTGIHSRYETTMLNTYSGSLVLTPGTALHLADPLETAFAIAGVSEQNKNVVIAADNTAKAASGGSYNATYYASLWSSTSSLTLARLSAAAVATASFVYTAWVDAGSPPPPGSPVDVPGPGAAARLALVAGPVPARGALALSFVLPAAGAVRCELVDVRGRRAVRLDLGERPAGAGRASLPLAGEDGALAPGVYFVRLHFGADVAEARVVVTR